ncbi:DUF6587 family protein [Lysobacter yangpyeongensis]|uniref:DUF6587 family protein n=1 Tax=Lysobacter yangpyeongensis TaxID=346182 RepID=A0ABW0SI73_9GAMM
MHAGLLAQYVVIALAVAASAAFVAQKQFPAGVRRLRIALAVPLVRSGRATWLQRLGRWIAPASRVGEGSCGGCHGCDTGKA